jgi:hypothetical protein
MTASVASPSCRSSDSEGRPTYVRQWRSLAGERGLQGRELVASSHQNAAVELDH